MRAMRMAMAMLPVVPRTAMRGLIVFCGGGADKDDEREGRVFVGKAGRLIRQLVKRFDLESAAYYTNAVACRSCAQDFDSECHTKFWENERGKVPAIFDRDAVPMQMEACNPRLMQEIYMVDPLFIVTLGGAATQAVVGKSSDSMETQVAKVPGAGYLPVLTDKKKQWIRKLKGYDEQ